MEEKINPARKIYKNQIKINLGFRKMIRCYLTAIGEKQSLAAKKVLYQFILSGCIRR